jgi:phosphatidyl-myo-inositol dimannoside synthase
MSYETWCADENTKVMGIYAVRILMLDNEFPPLGGGMGTANEALLRRFARLPDMRIDLITSALGNRLESEQFAQNIRIFKVPVWNQNIHHSSNRELLTYAAQALPLALRLHRRQPYDFCFAWSAVPAGAVARAIHWCTDLPYMVWASGPDIPGFEQRYRLIYPLLLPLLRSIWRHAAPLIAKCAQEIDMIQAADARAKVTYVPNGVDLTSFQPGAPVPEAGPLQIICVARLIERKGQHHLIEAVKRLADQDIDVVLSLVGTGDSLGSYEQLARDLGVAERVRFVGYVPRAAIAAHFAAAHVFALPSYNEGMAIAALEAMASGLPVVLTRTGGTEELVEEGLNGLTFDWADVGALTAHLRRLATDRTLARQMGAASRQRALQFSWDAIAETYLDIFKSLVHQSAWNGTGADGSGHQSVQVR